MLLFEARQVKLLGRIPTLQHWCDCRGIVQVDGTIGPFALHFFCRGLHFSRRRGLVRQWCVSPCSLLFLLRARELLVRLPDAWGLLGLCAPRQTFKLLVRLFGTFEASLAACHLQTASTVQLLFLAVAFD